MEDRVAFTFQLDPELVNAARRLAHTEGCEIKVIIEEALTDLLQKRRQPRAHVMAAFKQSVEKFGDVYKRLAE